MIPSEALRGVAFLRHLDESTLQILAQQAHERRFASGEQIVDAGVEGECIHVISEGLVKVFQPQAAEGDLVLGFLRRGDVVGELAILDPGVHTASAVAMKPTITWEIKREVFDGALARDPVGARRLLGALARELIESKDDLAVEKASLEDRVRDRTAHLLEAQLEIVRRLGLAAEYRDYDTGLHIQRMSKMCQLIAEKLGLSREDQELLAVAAPMHDVGKIGIPDEILLKPGRFNPDEWEVMKTHTTIGAQILSGSSFDLLQVAETIALSHHERWNGSGYPHALSKDEIPLLARVVAVCDVFDALISHRPYKEGWKEEEAVELIASEAGKHFDPEVSAAFLGLHLEGNDE